MFHMIDFFNISYHSMVGFVVYKISMLKIEQMLNLDKKIWKSVWTKKKKKTIPEAGK